MDGTAATLTPARETLDTLTGLARGRFGRITPRRIAEHIVLQMPDADWMLLRAALDALARRYSFAQRDGLALTTAPSRTSGIGTYRTRSADDRRRHARPYDTAIVSLTPLRTSCSCVDFVRSSLGLCKHALVALEALEANGALKRSELSEPSPSSANATLLWNPLQPLLGSTDRLERLRLAGGSRSRQLPGWKGEKPSSGALRNPEQRLAALVALEKQIGRGSLDAEPAVITLLAEERARAQRATDNVLAVPHAMRSLKGLQRKLYPYQRAGVQRFFEAGRLLLADDMGLGKTTQAIAACHGLFEARRVQRGLLIVPASLKSQWKREWDASTRAALLVVEGSPDERARQYAGTKRGFLIIGYEQLLRDFEHVTKFAPELVVLDEAQRIKNWATKSAAYVKALAPQFRLVLTGTPMENRYDELASIMDFVDDLALEPKWRLTPLHSMSAGNAGRGTSGAKNLTVLRERLAPVMLRRLRKDVLAQLPARVDTRVPVELTSVQREAHEDLRRPIARVLQNAAKRPLRQPEFLQLMQLLARQRMICNGMAQVHFEEDWPRCQAQQPTPSFLEGLFAPKLAALRGVIEPIVIAQKRKAIIFSQWRNMLRLSEWAVRDQLAAAGLRAVFFTGAESARQRERAIVEFHDDPAVAVLFLSDAGGVGLNLQRAASCCINLELPWNPAVLEQRIGRIYRLGQTQPIDVYNLVSEDCIESRIAALVERKRAVFSGLFDGTTDEVNFGEQTSFLDGIKKLVDPVAVPVLTSDDVDVPEPVAVSDDVVSASEHADKAAPAALAGLVIERLDDGSLRIAAPPQLAAPLAELFDQLARGLRAAGASAG
jgi:superfamily II DNA or RNA helicase